MEACFEKKRQLIKHMQDTLGFTEDDAEEALEELVEQKEGSLAWPVRIYGYAHNQKEDLYYAVSYLWEYDYGGCNYTIDCTPLKLTKVEKVIVENVFYRS